MRRLSLIAVALLFTLSSISAQQVVSKRVGLYTEGGVTTLADATTTLAVDLTIRHEEFVAGPYARYAQKYLGVRAPLNEKVSYKISGANIALADKDIYDATTEVAAPSLQTISHAGNEREFAKLLPGRTDSRALTADEAAREAANTIFFLRKSRQELITAQLGENVFGGGLEAALREIDKYENANLELFFGKEIVSTATERVVLMPRDDKFNYVLARFSEKDGLVPATDLSGEIVMLQIEPSGDTSLKYITEAGEKDKVQIDCRVADFATCVISCGTEPIFKRVLPLFEYGRSFKVAK